MKAVYIQSDDPPPLLVDIAGLRHFTKLLLRETTHCDGPVVLSSGVTGVGDDVNDGWLCEEVEKWLGVSLAWPEQKLWFTTT